MIKRYPDGRIDLVAVGRERFQVSFFDSEKAYLRGSVELLPDSEGDQEPSESLARQTLELYAQVSMLMGRARSRRNSTLNHLFKDWRLSWPLLFPLKMEFDSAFWKLRSEDQRLEELAGHLSALIPLLLKDKMQPSGLAQTDAFIDDCRQ